MVNVRVKSGETACCEDAAKACRMDNSPMVNSCPLFSPCVCEAKILQTCECCPAAPTTALCDSHYKGLEKETKTSVLDSYNEWETKCVAVSPLAVSRI